VLGISHCTQSILWKAFKTPHRLKSFKEKYKGELR
jgi:hypothetical protein